MRRSIAIPAILVAATVTAALSCDRAGTSGAAEFLSESLAEPVQGVVAFEHVTVIPMDSERDLRDYTVVVRDGRISAVGPARRTSIPAGAQRVDGAGKYLMPGLSDMHVHPYDTDQFIDYLAHGVTTIAVLNGSPAVLRWRNAVRSGALMGPTIYTAGPTVDGVPAGNPTFLSVATPDEGRRAVRQIKRDGFDFVKAYMTLTPATYAAITDEARRQRMAVVGHIPPAVGVDGVLDGRGQSVVAHAEEFFRERVDSARRDARMREMVKGVKAAGITVIPTLSGYTDYLRAIRDLRGVLNDPEMRFASPAAYSEKIPNHHRSVRPNQEQFRLGVERGLAQFRIFTKMLSDAGAPLFLGTDTETFGFAGQSLHEELREMVGAGLTPYQALVAGTRAPGAWVATHVVRSERFGVVARGQRADLLLLTANPLEDVENASRIAGVMTRGRWIPVSRLRTLRDSVAALYTPLHLLVARFDSLVAADRIDAAEVVLRELRRRDPGGRPFAQVAMWVNAQRLLGTDPSGAVRVLEWNVAMFPDSHGAHAALARGYLALGDTLRALSSATRARNLFSMHAPANAIVQLRSRQ
jgi:imidazolonepropionase-like amidohydrolase